MGTVAGTLKATATATVTVTVMVTTSVRREKLDPRRMVATPARVRAVAGAVRKSVARLRPAQKRPSRKMMGATPAYVRTVSGVAPWSNAMCSHVADWKVLSATTTSIATFPMVHAGE